MTTKDHEVKKRRSVREINEDMKRIVDQRPSDEEVEELIHDMEIDEDIPPGTTDIPCCSDREIN